MMTGRYHANNGETRTATFGKHGVFKAICQAVE